MKTRESSKKFMTIRKPNTAKYQKSISYQGPKLWNALSTEIQDMEDFTSFRHSILKLKDLEEFTSFRHSILKLKEEGLTNRANNEEGRARGEGGGEGLETQSKLKTNKVKQNK